MSLLANARSNAPRPLFSREMARGEALWMGSGGFNEGVSGGFLKCDGKVWNVQQI